MYIYKFIECLYLTTQYNKNGKNIYIIHTLTTMIKHFPFEFCVNMGFYCGSSFFEI